MIRFPSVVICSTRAVFVAEYSSSQKSPLGATNPPVGAHPKVVSAAIDISFFRRYLFYHPSSENGDISIFLFVCPNAHQKVTIVNRKLTKFSFLKICTQRLDVSVMIDFFNIKAVYEVDISFRG